MKLRLLAAVALLIVPLHAAENPTERRLKQLSKDIEYAVMPIMDWGEHYPSPNEMPTVIGTAFLLNKEGYFVTAAHVLANHKDKNPRVVVITRQADDNGMGSSFEEIERDTQHDLALCKMQTEPRSFDPAKLKPEFRRPGLRHPFATLHVSSSPVEAGEFIVIAGFPLGSYTATVQFGAIAATRTLSPSAGRIPAGQRELLQVAVSGNQGNSGSPVIDFDSGRVIGVVVQAVPSPLFGPRAAQLPLAQSSGLMLAVPARWLNKLLADHHVVPDNFRLR